jgi:hypothetical protein
MQWPNLSKGRNISGGSTQETFKMTSIGRKFWKFVGGPLRQLTGFLLRKGSMPVKGGPPIYPITWWYVYPLRKLMVKHPKIFFAALAYQMGRKLARLSAKATIAANAERAGTKPSE